MSQTKIQLIKDGALAEDSIVHDGDTNTKIRFSGADTITAETGGSERLRVDSSGNVGIGTSSPSAKLEIFDSTTGDVTLLRLRSNPGVGDTQYLGFDGSSNSSRARIGSEIISGGHGNLVFETRDSTTANLTERMRIDSSGNVLIGTTTAGNAHDNGDGIEIGESNGLLIGVVNKQAAVFARHSGQGELLRFQSGNTDVGSIDTSGSGVNYTSGSDYRLKENIVALTDGITRLKTLKPSRFNFISDPDKTVDGFIAHEVTAVPEAVTGTKDEVDSNNKPIYQGIDLGKLVPLLTAALQEEIAKREALEARVATLEAA